MGVQWDKPSTNWCRISSIHSMIKIWWNSAKSGSSTSRAVLFRCGALWLLQAEWLGCSITLHSVSGSPLRCWTMIEKCLKHYQTAQQLHIWTGYRDKELLQHPLQRSELNSALKVIWIHQGIEVSYVHFCISSRLFLLVSSFVVSWDSMAFLPEFESVKGKADKNCRRTMAYLMRKPWKSHGKASEFPSGNRPPMVPPKVSPCQAKDLSLAADKSWWKVQYIYIYIHICIYIYIYVYVYIYIYILYMRVHKLIRWWNILCIFMCVYMCIYVYIYVYIYILTANPKKNRKSRKVIHHIKPITITWVRLGRTWATRSNELGTGTFKGQGRISIQGLHSGSCLGLVMKSW